MRGRPYPRRGRVKIPCDICQQPVEDSLMQIMERGSDILYLCPECYQENIGEAPDEQA